MRRLANVLSGLLVVAMAAAVVASCSYFHDKFPDDSCQTGMDCFKGIETCDTTTHTCVPVVDAAPRPDSMPAPDADLTPDADLPDADLTPDADLPDADLTPDADLPDAT